MGKLMWDMRFLLTIPSMAFSVKIGYVGVKV